MWSPAVAAVRVKEIPCVYAPVNVKNGKEGYRGWCNGMGLMKHLTGKKLDAAYEYLNWYLSGWQGAFVGRYGYYSPVPSTAKKFLTRGGVGLLVRRQAGARGHQRSLWRSDGEGRHQARWRFVPRPRQEHLVLEHADGRSRLHEQALERLQGRLTQAINGCRRAQSGRQLTPFNYSGEIEQGPRRCYGEIISAWLYVAPLMLVLVPFFLLPILVVLAASFFETDGFGGLLPKLHAGELSGRSDLGADLPALSGDTEIHRPDLVLHADHRFPGRLFPGVPRPQPVAGDRSVPALHGAVLDLEHHPDDFLDSAARQGRADQLRL